MTFQDYVNQRKKKREEAQQVSQQTTQQGGSPFTFQDYMNQRRQEQQQEDADKRTKVANWLKSYQQLVENGVGYHSMADIDSLLSGYDEIKGYVGRFGLRDPKEAADGLKELRDYMSKFDSEQQYNLATLVKDVGAKVSETAKKVPAWLEKVQGSSFEQDRKRREQEKNTQAAIELYKTEGAEGLRKQLSATPGGKRTSDAAVSGLRPVTAEELTQLKGIHDARVAEDSAWYNNIINTDNHYSEAIGKTFKDTFGDGFDLSDIPQFVMGVGGPTIDIMANTAVDAAGHFAKGFVSNFEGIADLLFYGVGEVADLVGWDSGAEWLKAAATRDTTGELFAPLSKFQDVSAAGDTLDSVAEGVGQMFGLGAISKAFTAAGMSAKAANTGTTAAMFANATGHGISEAYQHAETVYRVTYRNAINSGATAEEATQMAIAESKKAVSDGEAWAYGVMAGTAETISEMLFSGANKMMGISSFSSMDDALAEKFASAFKNRFIATGIELGIKSGAEGVEEIAAGYGSALAKKLTYMSEEDIGKLIENEKLMDQFIIGTLSAAIGQSGAAVQSVQTGRDMITGLNENEQAVIDAVVEERVAEKKEKGETVKKSKIEAQVRKEMERGEIPLETIGRVLGGETYKAYKETEAQEKAASEELAALYEGEEGKQVLDKFMENSKLPELQEQLNREVASKVENSYLAESYNQAAQRGKRFTADLSQYDDAQRVTVRKAVESGVLNNTRATHEFVDLVAKLAAARGITFDFTTNQKLRQTGLALEGKTVNGYVDANGNITVNMNSPKYLNTVVGHEVAHVLEETELYEDFQKFAVEFGKSRNASDSKFENEYQERLRNAIDLYQNVEGYEGAQGLEKIKKEVVADLVGDYLFTDSAFLERLGEKPGLARKIYNKIKQMYRMATAGSKEARQLEQLKNKFEKMFQAKSDSKADTKTDAKGDIKYSLTDSNGKNLTNGQQDYFAESQARDDLGQLVSLYHGTENGGFTEFDPQYSDDGISLFMTDNIQMAATYSNSTDPIQLAKGKPKILRWMDGDPTKGKGQKGVYNVYANLKNPLIVDAKGENWDNLSSEDGYQTVRFQVALSNKHNVNWSNTGIKLTINTDGQVQTKLFGSMQALQKFVTENYNQALANNVSLAAYHLEDGGDGFVRAKWNPSTLLEGWQENTREIARKAKEQGYDGVIIRNVLDSGKYGQRTDNEKGTVYIAFDSNQIKSVDNKKPTDDPDIRYSLSQEGQQQRTYGDYRVSGEDVLLDGEQVQAEKTLLEVFMDEQIRRQEDEEKSREAYWRAVMQGNESHAEGEETNAISKPLNSYPVEKQKVILSYIRAVDEKLKDFVKSVKNGDLRFKRQKISNVSERAASDIGNLLGIDVSGYTNNINTSGVHHIVSRHGANGEHDSTMSLDDDIARVGWVLENYDKVELLTENGKPIFSSSFMDKHNKPAPQIRFTKKIDGTYYVVEAACENNYKKLWVQSAYLQKNEDVTQASAEGNTTDHGANAQGALASPSSENIISGNADFVNSEAKSIGRKDLHEHIIDNIRAKFAENGLDYDSVLKNAKDLSTFATVDNTPQRVMEKALGYKAGQILSDITVNKVAQNETEAIKWLNSFTDRKNGLLAQISKQYHIKPGSKESAAAQMYAEGFFVNGNNEIVQYADAELAQDFPDKKTQANIKGLARDPRIRKIYDETLAMINDSRVRNAYPEIPKLDNYFLHFRAMDDTFSKLGLPFNPNDIRAKDLPTDLNGVTADLKPGQPYFASAMHRKGKRTSFDLLGGLERYLTSAKNQIFHIDDIQTLRALRNYIADTYGQANGLEGLDTLSEEEAQERIKQVYNSHLSTFAKFLNEEANILAGKTALIDRGLEGIIGRRGITTLDAINRQVGANMVGYNVSSAMTNMLAAVQGFAKTNKFDFLKGFAQFGSNKISSIFGKNDGFAENSSVMVRRKGADRFHRTVWQKLSDPGYALMSAVDSVSTELIARAKYNEYTRKGMDSKQADIETDKWVSRLMGDRSLGQMPQLYNSKMLGLITKFQLEVRNQLDSQFYDTIQEANASTKDIQNGLARNAKKAAKITSAFVQLAVGQHLFGMAFESIAGYNPAFDIIDVLYKMFGWDDDEDDEDTVLDNIEEGFLALLGDLPYTSTFTGGRIPISSALPIEEFVTGKDEYGNEKSRWDTLMEAAPYYVLPGGYGQIKKTGQGLSMFDDDLPIAGSYTDKGALRFPVEDTWQNRLQAGLFGQWANENAQDYIDNSRTPLQEKQIQEFIDVDIPIEDYWEYREGLKGLTTIEEKADYIYSLDLPIEKKNLLINNLSGRKEPIDLTDYGLYDSFEEFDYAQQNPEKYAFLEKEGIGYKGWKNLDEDTKASWSWAFTNQDEYKHYKANGIMPEDYRVYRIPMLEFDNEADSAYQWSYDNPEKAKIGVVFDGGVKEYRGHASKINAIPGDKDANGKTINGSRKVNVWEYIDGLNIDEGEKLILFKTEYPNDHDYDREITQYLIGRKDLSLEDKRAILTQLGAKVDSQGYVTWE